MIVDLLDKRINTRCFSDKSIPDSVIKELLEVLNRIPAKENQMPTEVYVLGQDALDEKNELYVNTECSPNVFNPQVLAPLVFCFVEKEKMVDGNGITDVKIPKVWQTEIHRYYTGMALMALSLSALEQGLSVGICQSQGLCHIWPDWKERGGAFTYNNEYKKVSLSLGIGYPEYESTSSRARMPNKIAKNLKPDAVRRASLGETSRRPKLKNYVKIIGQDITLPKTWQNRI
jgi:hypothetical protein